MGAADREAVARGLMHVDGLDLVPVEVDDDTYRQAYDVVANTTLWYCTTTSSTCRTGRASTATGGSAWEGYRAYNRAMADAVVARADEGDVVLVQDYHFSLLGRMLAERRPDLRTVHFLHTPFAAPAIFEVLPDDVAAELLDGMAGYGACGFHCHKWEACFLGCYAAAGRPAPRDLRRPARPRRRRTGRGGGVARGRGGGRRVACRVGRPSRHRPDGPHGAVEEHRARDARLRGAAEPRVPSGGARWCTWPSRIRRRQGLAEYLAYAADVEHTAERINHAWADPRTGPRSCCALADDRARSLAALTLSDVLLVNPVRDGLNLVAKEGPLLNRDDGVARALTRGRGMGGAGAGRRRRPRREPLRPHRYGGGAAPGALHGAVGAGGARRGAADCGVRRTSADWWADQLAAAQD